MLDFSINPGYRRQRQVEGDAEKHRERETHRDREIERQTDSYILDFSIK